MIKHVFTVPLPVFYLIFDGCVEEKIRKNIKGVNGLLYSTVCLILEIIKFEISNSISCHV